MCDAFFLWWTFLDNFTKVHLKHKGSIFFKLSAHGESIKQTRDIIIKMKKKVCFDYIDCFYFYKHLRLNVFFFDLHGFILITECAYFKFCNFYLKT